MSKKTVDAPLEQQQQQQKWKKMILVVILFVRDNLPFTSSLCYALNVLISFEKAINRDYALKWKSSVDAKIQSVEVNDTFKLPLTPVDKKSVAGKRVFTMEADPENAIYKLRYEANVYS